MVRIEEPWKIRKACHEKGIYVVIKPIKQGKLSDVKLIVDVRGDFIKGKEVYSQSNPQELYQKIDEVYLWAYRNY